MVALEHEVSSDAGTVEALLDRAMGPERRRKTAERLREGNRAAIALVARDADDSVVGTIRLWPVTIGGRHRALLLGPLAVAPERQGGGIGARLMQRALAEAAWRGHRAVLLVGDAPYYQRFGFTAAPTAGLTLPGPVDRARFLALELVPGALKSARGKVAVPAPAARREKIRALHKNILKPRPVRAIELVRRTSHVPQALSGQATT